MIGSVAHAIEHIRCLHPVLQALIAGCFTWFMTALGAAAVFGAREMNRRILDTALGFAAGVMIAASFWSLLNPAIEMARGMSVPMWFPAAVGFLAGGALLAAIDRLLPHIHAGLARGQVEGIKTSWNRSILLVLAVTLHNIPEGLAVGVAFGAVAAGASSTTFASAVALAVGLGIQNLPEGMAVAMPLRREGFSKLRSFWYGQLSGMVEPLAAVAGAAAVIVAQPFLPYALGFAAGAMIYVVVEELIPEAQCCEHAHLATAGIMVGFVIMMILDVAAG